VPVKPKRKRRSKEELKQPGAAPPRQNAINFRVTQQEGRFERKIPWNAETKTEDAPYYTYVDVIAEKTDSIAQNAALVERSFRVLSDTGLFKENGFTELIWWSDGCGKHFKCYQHLWHVSMLMAEFTSVIRKFLPPLQSFNICDSHSTADYR